MTQTKSPSFNNIVIYGHNFQALFTCIFLLKKVPKDISITWVKPPFLEGPSALEFSPEALFLASYLDVDLIDWMGHAKANFNCGQYFYQWPDVTSKPRDFFFPFLNDLSVSSDCFPKWLCAYLRKQTSESNFLRQSFPYYRFLEDKCSPISIFKEVLSPPQVAFGLQVETKGAFEYLFNYIKSNAKRPFKLIEAYLEKVLSDEKGYVQSLQLEDASEVKGHLFLDCSQKQVLASQKQDDFLDLTPYFACDSYYELCFETTSKVSLAPFTQVWPNDFGILKIIQLYQKVFCQFYFHSDYTPEKESVFEAISRALGEENENVKLVKNQELQAIKLQSGYHTKLWEKNHINLSSQALCSLALPNPEWKVLCYLLDCLEHFFPSLTHSETLAHFFNQHASTTLQSWFSHLYGYLYGLKTPQSKLWEAFLQKKPLDGFEEKMNLFLHNYGHLSHDHLCPLLSKGALLESYLFTQRGLVPHAYHPQFDYLSLSCEIQGISIDFTQQSNKTTIGFINKRVS